jgi:pyruvate dehydrogenase E2 component (dihydrolipoamide acetyltransferase)
MIHDVVMPQLGMTMTEGSVAQWLKAVGDPIAKGEPLFVVQTDKVDMDVESMRQGYVIELLLNEQITVPVGTVIARIADSLVADVTAASSMTASSMAASSMAAGQTQLVSPRARRVAQELGIDLAQVKGTGEQGRVREADVRAAFALQAPQPDPARVENRSAPVARRHIAERMEQSVRTVPQFSLRRELDAQQLTLVRSHLLPVVEARDGLRLSFTDFLLKALAMALREVPDLNSSWHEGRLEQRREVNIGFAAQSPSRLLVPVMHAVDGLAITQIARQRADFARRAKEGKLKPDEMQGASCTLSNLGAFGVDEFEALINPGESCILAAGRILPRPFVVDGALTIRPTLKLTLSVDHRVADGVLAATFLTALAKVIEQPATMLI